MNRKVIFIFLLLVLLIPSSKKATADVPKRILLIIMDGARYDYCTPETMPNLFSFMKEAMVFKNAYAPSSWTLPSHASLFTGLYPQQHGAFRLPNQSTNNDNINIDDIAIPQEATTLADILRSAGYHTLGVFGNPCYGYPVFNLSKGFDIWINVVENNLKRINEKNRGFYSFDYEVDGKFHTVIPTAAEVAKEVNSVLLSSGQGKQIFLFINFEDPIATPLYFPPKKRDEIKSNYKKYLQASMRRIDDILPPILSFFRDGLIIVTSDHGQGDGSKFRPAAHFTSLHPYQTHIPLFIYNYRAKKLDVEKPIDLTRIMNIILETTGLAHPDNNMFYHPDVPYAFGHLDPHPTQPIGGKVRFSIYTNLCHLTLMKTANGLFKLFDHDQASEMFTSDLFQTEYNLSGILLPFTKLQRVFSNTGKHHKLDEKNVEMLKSLGYIE